MTSISTLLNELQAGLSPAAKEQLRGLANTATAERLLEESDAALQARRAELAQQMATAPRATADRLAALAQERALAEVRVKRAEQELAQARDAHSAAVAAALGADFTARAAVAAAELELQRTADPRLEHFANICLSLLQRARHAVTEFPLPKESHGRTGFASNLAKVERATEALRSAAGDALASRIVVEPAPATTERLRTWCAQLSDALRPLGLRAPHLTQDGAIELGAVAQPINESQQ